MTIEEALENLIVQATKERSHYYVKSICEEALDEIKRLNNIINAQIKVISNIRREINDTR